MRFTRIRLSKLFIEFFESEQSSGILLILCTLSSIVLANSFLGRTYSDLWHIKIGFEMVGIKLKYSIEHWINDGLMAIFFCWWAWRLRGSCISENYPI